MLYLLACNFWKQSDYEFRFYFPEKIFYIKEPIENGIKIISVWYSVVWQAFKNNLMYKVYTKNS